MTDRMSRIQAAMDKCLDLLIEAENNGDTVRFHQMRARRERLWVMMGEAREAHERTQQLASMYRHMR